MPPRRGRRRRTSSEDEGRDTREHARKKQKMHCPCAKPGCSGLVAPSTFRDHAKWTAARAAEAEERKGVEDLLQGYPAPPHEHVPGLDVQLGLSDGDDGANVHIASEFDDSDVDEEAGVDEEDVEYGPQLIRCSATRTQHNTHNYVSV